MEFWKAGSKRAQSKISVQLYAEDIQDLWDRRGVIDYLERQYRKEIESGFDWEDIKEEMTRVEDDFDDAYLSVYIGSVFAFWPSGKFWTFWACGNMTMREMVKDTIYTETLENVLSEHDMWHEQGEGDPTDVFFCKALNNDTEEE